MNKALIGLFIIILIIGGGIILLGKKPSAPGSSVVSRVEVPDDTNTAPVTSTPQSNTAVSDKVDESKNQITLTITQPLDGQSTTSSSIVVKGRTKPNADISINDKDLKADSQGNFSLSVTLDEGDNVITVIAVDETGQSAEKDLTVTYDTGQ